MPDTPQRIATDTSQKLAIRYGETIKAYQASPRLSVEDLKLIPLVFAGWLRYLMAVDDQGSAFSLSPDPLLEQVRPCVAGFVPGVQPGEEAVRSGLRDILSDRRIFGVDLWEAGLGDTVCRYFHEMLAGPGAVRAVLEKYVQPVIKKA